MVGDTSAELPLAVQGTRVLVVDDNATYRQILLDMLRNWQIQGLAVASAGEALAVLRTAQQEGQPYPLVLVDADMPGVDGFALAQQLQSPQPLAGRVIMLLTSGDRPGEIARCEQLGVAAHLLKPIKPSELFDAIVWALGVTTTEPEPEEAKPAAAPELPPLRVLVAEDSLVNQKLAVGMLQRHGHQVTVANNGREAVAAVESQVFDVVLMDVQMPEMDGYEATAAIRSRERAVGPPHADHRHDGARHDQATASGAWKPAWTTTCPSRSAPGRCSRSSAASCVPSPRRPADPSIFGPSRRIPPGAHVDTCSAPSARIRHSP